MLGNIHQDSLLNAFFLSILATAGLFYVNLGGSFLSAYVDGDEADWSKNVGAGYKGTWKDLGYYVEANYNLDSEDITQAMGVSVSF